MLLFLGDPETFRTAIPGQKFGVKVHAVNQANPTEVTVKATQVESSDPETYTGAAVEAAATKPAQIRKFEVTVPEKTHYTRPYFSRPDIEQPYYDIAIRSF